MILVQELLLEFFWKAPNYGLVSGLWNFDGGLGIKKDVQNVKPMRTHLSLQSP
jgi:hypothetical protein